MSIVAFKRKSVIQYGSNRSGKPPGGYWLPQGPFGNNTMPITSAVNNYVDEGFSLNGSTRNIGYIGKTSHMSKTGTPYKGMYATGNGGSGNNYYTATPVFIVNRAVTSGPQYKYIKPSVLSTKGMLEKKYKWIHNGQYPNYWVQPNYGSSNLSETPSQGSYINNLSVSNDCITDVNNPSKYDGNIKNGGSTLCKTSTAGFTYNDMARNGLYTKTVNSAQMSSDYTKKIQQKCQTPKGPQKPFPFATNGNACNAVVYLKPPDWYVK
jgi:hypothetical protein